MNWDSLPTGAVINGNGDVISSDPCDIMESGWSPEDDVRVFLISGYQRTGKTELTDMMHATHKIDNEGSVPLIIGMVYHAALTAKAPATIVVESLPLDAPVIAENLRKLVEDVDGASFRHIVIGV